MEELDKQFRSSLDLVLQIYENRISKGNHELQTLKAEAVQQKENTSGLMAELRELRERNASLEEENSALLHENSSQLRENKALAANNKSITAKYNALKKDTLKLEAFRRSIASMVDTSGKPEQSVADMSGIFEDQVESDQSFSSQRSTASMNTATQERVSFRQISPAKPTVSSPHHQFQPEAFLPSPKRLPSKAPAMVLDYSSPVKSGFAETKTPTPRRSEPSSPLRIDAPELYRQIQDSLSATQFQKFAMLIGEFNSEHKSAEQTIEAISQLIRDRSLFGQMKTLIFSALSEKLKS
ncbi:MAG: hypothetical protein SGCHY_002495 [Lobulomycetales sp.]